MRIVLFWWHLRDWILSQCMESSGGIIKHQHLVAFDDHAKVMQLLTKHSWPRDYIGLPQRYYHGYCGVKETNASSKMSYICSKETLLDECLYITDVGFKASSFKKTHWRRGEGRCVEIWDATTLNIHDREGNTQSVNDN